MTALSISIVVLVGCGGEPRPSPPAASTAPPPPAVQRREIAQAYTGAALTNRFGGSVAGTRLLLHHGDSAAAAMPETVVGRSVRVLLRALPSPNGRWPTLVVSDGVGTVRLDTAQTKDRLPVPAARLARLSLNDLDQESWPVLELRVDLDAAGRRLTFLAESAGQDADSGTIMLDRVVWRGWAVPGQLPTSPPAAIPRVLMIGIDGAGWKTLTQVLAGRRLGTFERLMGRGAYGPLRSELPTISPALWNTIVTGKERERHGVTDFTVPSKAGPVPVSANQRRAAALWEILALFGVRTTVVNWWTTWPAESVLDGNVIVSDGFVRNRAVERGVFPRGLTPRLPAPSAAADAEHFLPMLGDRVWFGKSDPEKRYTATWRLDSNLSDLRHFALEDIDVAAIARAVATPHTPVACVYFRGYDPAAHFFGEHSEPVAFAPYLQGLSSPAELNALPRYLELLDALIADLIRAYRMDPARDVIIVLSDHGSAKPPLTPATAFRLNYLFQQLGWLEWHYGRDASWDPDATAVFSGNSAFGDGAFRAVIEENLKTPKFGRFGLPEGDRSRQERIVSVLRSLRTVRGEPLFRLVVPAAGERAHRASVPVATVVFNPAISSGDVLVHDGREISLAPYVYFNKTMSEHDEYGFFVLAGPRVLPGYVANVRIADIVPTLLPLLGLPVAADFDGRVVDDVYDHRVSRQFTWTDSYDPAMRRIDIPPNLQPDKAYLERLRSLGYIR